VPVGADESDLMGLIQAIASGDSASALRLLAAEPSLAGTRLRQGASRRATAGFFLEAINHYVYAGDSALHVAAAGYRWDVAGALVSSGADVSARNRRGAQPLHYAADGTPGRGHWNPPAQAATIAYLIEMGADPDAADADGTCPLHRAARTRCAAAVTALLAGGADPRRTNGRGSTPLKLATSTTGRGGTGSDRAREEQAEIVRLLMPDNEKGP
jgi:ankyrin repeat protein